MPTLSKQYAQIVGQINCKEVFHPGRNCGQFASENFGKIFQMCAKFFLPIVLAQYARSATAIDANVIKEFFKTLLQLTFSSYLGSAVGQSLNCVSSRTVGFPHPIFLVFLPSAIGNTWGFIAPSKVYGLITNGQWTMIFEAIYRLDDTFPLLTLIHRSAVFRTLIFMAMSQFIIDSKCVQKSDIFWFIQTSRPETITSSNEGVFDPSDIAAKLRPNIDSPLMDRLIASELHICEHVGSCDEHIYSGAKTNFKLGLGIEVFRLLVANFRFLQRQPLEIFGKMLNMKTGFIVFLVGYSTIYRATICGLNRYHQQRIARTQSLAAFLSGSAYLAYPNFTILAHATISTIKLFWARYVRLNTSSDENKKTHSDSHLTLKIMQMRRLVSKLPLRKLLHVLGIGIAFHMRTFYPWMCPKFMIKSFEYTSGGNVDQSMLRLTQFMLGFQPLQTSRQKS